MIRRAPLLLILLQCIKLILAEFEILILHTNDMHARFDETDEMSNLINNISDTRQRRFGGFARLKTALDEARGVASEQNIPSIFLNAGDTFQGTAFYTLLKDEVVADLLPLLKIDVMSLGNHEFDDGPEVLARYLEKVQIPVVAANLDFKDEPSLQNSNYLTKSQVVQINGKKIGVIGYLTSETKTIASTGRVIFKDEIETIREEARNLKNDGVNIIIALGHSGIDVDKQIAKEVIEVSLVIGGHTNTFLYNPPDKKPSIEIPEGTYPIIVEQSSGKKVPVVSAYAYTKYLGKLWATFDDNGNFISAKPYSNAMLIDSTITKNQIVQDRVDIWRSKINSKMLQIVGQTNVYLDGWRASCKILECNLGNMLTDSFVDYVAEKYTGTTGWTDAPVAFINSGGMRVSTDPNKIHGNMTFNEVLTFLPYRAPLSKAVIKGWVLRDALEHAVARYTPIYNKEVPNEFLQLSGVHVIYDISKPPNKRIVKVEVRCGNCTVPRYAPLKDNENIGIVTIKYLIEGGDSYDMLKNKATRVENVPGENGNEFMTDTDSLARLIEKYKVVYPEVSGRITIINANSSAGSTDTNTFLIYQSSSSISISTFNWQYSTVLTFTLSFIFKLH